MCHLPRILFIRSINQGEALKRIVLKFHLECAHLYMSQVFMDVKVDLVPSGIPGTPF